ncbi:Hypothetical predicted protein [Paramuricea clavata]|uniref:Uncharacterized protein n=1 Tax=Paramuricea clavata TaxID=317549 RepID=A0A6S7I3U8_PARCT|nr:Hypothetical predicted protein [Paramuricea clavata]
MKGSNRGNSDSLPFLRRMYDVFLDSERRSRKELKEREKEARRKIHEESRGWEKSITKEEQNRRGRIRREKAAEKKRAKEEQNQRGKIIRERAAEKKREKEKRKQANQEKKRLRDLNETVIQRERRLRRNEYERTRRRKKKEAEARYLELTPIQENSAIRGMVEKYKIEPTTAFDVLTFLELVRPRVRELLDGLRGNMSRNIRLELICLMGKELVDGKEELKEVNFMTENYKLHGVGTLTDEIWEQMKDKILLEFSRYVLKRVQRLFIHVGKFIPTNEDRMKSETVRRTSVHELQCISDRFVDDLVAKKGVYPYEYMDDHEKLDRSRLPPKRFFYNGLKMEDITDEEYERAKKVWKTFGMKSMLDYHNLYLVTDTLILSDVIENFRKESRETYGLGSPWYYTAPGLSWEAALKKTMVKLELITSPRMYRFIEKGIRGGISTSVMRYGTVDNKYVGISEVPEGIINLMRDLDSKIRKDPTDIREKVLEFENEVCKFLWDYNQEDDDKIMKYIERNLTRWVTCLSDHGKEDDSILTSKI